MKINRKDFLGVIQKVAPLCKTRTTLPILSNVLIKAMNGNFTATASDGDSFVYAACCCDGDLSECCVSPLPLLAIAAYGPDEMTLTVDESRLAVHCGSQSKLPFLKGDEFPKFPSDGLKELGVNVVDLALAINSVAWAANATTWEIGKKSVYVQMNTEKHRLVAFAMDGRRMGLFNRNAVVPNCTLLFPAEYAKIIAEALLNDGALIKYNDEWIVVNSEGFRCAVSQVSGYTPPMDAVFNVFANAQEVAEIPLPETIKCLETMKSVAGVMEFVTGHATFEKDKMLLEYVGSLTEFHSSVTCPLMPPNSKGTKTSPPMNVAGASDHGIQIRFDATLLHNVLKNTPGTFAKVKINGTNALFESGDTVMGLALVKGEYKV